MAVPLPSVSEEGHPGSLSVEPGSASPAPPGAAVISMSWEQTASLCDRRVPWCHSIAPRCHPTVSPHMPCLPKGCCGHGAAGTHLETGITAFQTEQLWLSAVWDPLLLFGLKEKREFKKKKGKCWFCFGWGARATRNVGKPQLGLPCSRHGMVLWRGGTRGFSLPALLRQSTKPSPGLQELCGNRDHCWEVAACRQGGGCSLQVAHGALGGETSAGGTGRAVLSPLPDVTHTPK